LHTNQGTRTPTHALKTPEARKTHVAISDRATHKPQYARGAKYQYKIHTNTQWHTNKYYFAVNTE